MRSSSRPPWRRAFFVLRDGRSQPTTSHPARPPRRRMQASSAEERALAAGWSCCCGRLRAGSTTPPSRAAARRGERMIECDAAHDLMRRLQRLPSIIIMMLLPPFSRRPSSVVVLCSPPARPPRSSSPPAMQYHPTFPYHNLHPPEPRARELDVEVHHRPRKHVAVEAVEQTAVAREQLPGILYPGVPLHDALHKVPEKARLQSVGRRV